MISIEFSYHKGFEKEIAALERRFPRVWDGVRAFERICQKQFNPVRPETVVPPGKLHRIREGETWSAWKVKLAVPDSGLRPNQMPRVWFAVRGAEIAFLNIATHIDNYNDNDVERVALDRATDIF